MLLSCEVCGNPIHGQPQTVNIDGGIFRVCYACAKLGTPAIVRRPSKPPTIKLRSPQTPLNIQMEHELRRDYNLVIRQAREKMGLSQEALGRNINEKPSVIKLLESGKLKPDNILAKKIEHFLRVEMLVPVEIDL